MFEFETMNKARPSRPVALGLVLLLALALTQCTTLKKMSGIRKPQVQVEGVELEALSFDGARLRFDLKVSNPNPVGIHLSGFDYLFEIEQRPFLQGSETQALDISANGSSRVSVPAAFRFDDLLAHLQALSDNDESPYTMTVTFSFNLPVLGEVRVPISSSGMIPVIRVPQARLMALRLERLSLSRADLLLVLEVSNPNGFSLQLASMEYDFSVNQQEWVLGILQESTPVEAQAISRIELPLSLDFTALGGSIRQLLLGQSRLNYAFNANLGIGTSLPLLEEVMLPLHLSGEISLTR
jgi:LEA14-like dessication related protein